MSAASALSNLASDYGIYGAAIIVILTIALDRRYHNNYIAFAAMLLTVLIVYLYNDVDVCSDANQIKWTQTSSETDSMAITYDVKKNELIGFHINNVIRFLPVHGPKIMCHRDLILAHVKASLVGAGTLDGPRTCYYEGIIDKNSKPLAFHGTYSCKEFSAGLRAEDAQWDGVILRGD